MLRRIWCDRENYQRNIVSFAWPLDNVQCRVLRESGPQKKALGWLQYLMDWIQRPEQCLSDINRRSAAIPLGFIAIFLAEPEGSHRVSHELCSSFSVLHYWICCIQLAVPCNALSNLSWTLVFQNKSHKTRFDERWWLFYVSNCSSWGQNGPFSHQAIILWWCRLLGASQTFAKTESICKRRKSLSRCTFCWGSEFEFSQ